MQKYGEQSRKAVDIFRNIKEGEIQTVPESNVSIESLRTYAGVLNSMAGYTKYSISRDRLLKVIRVIYNERP